MSKELNWQKEKANEVFDNVVKPALRELVEEYDGTDGFEVKIVSDSPIITGIERYASIMFIHPDGLEMMVCVYWIKGSDRIVAENISMVTLNRNLDIYQVTKEELKKNVKFLAGVRG